MIAKYPLDRRPFWLARARHEITVYQALPALAPLPMTVPDMVAAEPIRPLIVMTTLIGDPVHTHRYPVATIHSGQLGEVVSLLDRVHAWRPAIPSALPYDDDYPGQLAAVCADLSHPHSLPTETFDCIVLTQTLQLLADPTVALTNCHQALGSGSALLFSAWDGPVTVTDHGNLRVCLAALLGEAAEDLAPAELAHHDPDFPLVSCVIAHRTDTS